MRDKQSRRDMHLFKGKDKFTKSRRPKNSDSIKRVDGNYYKEINVDGKKYNSLLTKGFSGAQESLLRRLVDELDGISGVPGGGDNDILGLRLDEATEAQRGVTQLGTLAETTEGTLRNRGVTPYGLNQGYQGTSNVVTTGALNSGSITSGFGSIDTGSSTISTTGNISAGGLIIGGHTVDDIDIGSEFTDTDDHLMSSGAIKEKIESYGYSTASGDITGVTITTDSGGGSAASDTGGSADFSILGSNGVGVTNSGTTITATAVPGEIDHDSLNNFVANEHIDWTGASAGTIHATNYTNTTYSEATGSAEGLMSTAHHDKLDGIEANADVTDTANVTSAGALMDSEVTNLSQVKSFDSSDYATAAQGSKADSAQQPPSEGAFANGDKTKLDGIASGATANTGDITRVKLLGDSGNYTIDSGNADITFQGDSVIETEIDDNTVLFAVDTASATGKGVVELATTAETTTGTDATRAVTPDGLKDSGYMGFEFIQLINAGFNYSYTAGTKVYVPLVGYNLERNSQFAANELLSYVAPYDGKLNQVVFRSEEACGSTVCGFHKSSTGTESPSGTASATVTVDMAADDTAYKFAFTSNNTFSAGDIINISFDPTNDANDTVFTAEFILDRSSGL